MSQFKSRSLVLSFALLCGLLCVVGGPACGAEAADALGTAAIQAAALDRLEAKAELGGTLPVIVRLRTETLPAIEPPTDLGGNPARAQRKLGDRARLVARAQDRLAAAVAGHPVRINRYRYLPLAAMQADRDTIRRLRALPDVLSVTEDRPHAPLLNTSVPRIGGNLAYNQGWTGAGQAVAVIDTGVQTSHPYFANRVLHDAEACYSGAYIGYLTTLCPNLPADCPEVLVANGGIPSHTACGSGAGVECTGHGSCYHGTHVSGIVLSGDSTYRGVAPGANLIPIQVFVIEGGNLWAYDSDIIAGLEHVLRLSQAGTPIAAVNMSLGGDIYTSARECNLDSAPTKTAIDALRAAGIATVVAAGNSGVRTAISTPGCISSAVSVGATEDSDAIAYFSNLAPALTVFAPGYSVFSSVPTNAVGGASGTSMAAPHVAGALAVLREKAAQTLLTPSVDNLVAALRLSGTPITDGTNTYSTPRIQLDQALSLVTSPLPVEVIMDSETAAAGVTTVSGSFTSVADTKAYGGSALRGATGTSQANTLRFTPTLTPGYYNVYAWWPALSGNSSQALMRVGGGTRTEQYFINQLQNGGRWNLVGPAYLDATNHVEISDGGVPQVTADALRLLAAEPLAITTTALADSSVGLAYNIVLGASGGIPPYSWSLASGALPPGLTLDSASGNLTGTPTQVGSYSFTVKAGDGYTQSTPQALSINVAASSSWSPDIVLDNGDPGTQVITGKWNAYGTDPEQKYGSDWLADDRNTTGDTYRFTPTILHPGQYRVLARWVTHPNRSTRAPYDIRHAGGVDTVETNQQLTGGQWNVLGVYTFAAGTGNSVEISDRNGRAVIADAVMFQYVSEPPATLPLSIRNVSLQAGELSIGYSAQLTASGGAAPYNWNLVTGSLPPGVALNAVSGLIEGTPLTPGTFVFSVSVTDAYGASISADFSIVINFTPPSDIILDNGGIGTRVIAGKWNTYATDPEQKYAADWLADDRNTTGDIYRFTPTIPRAGQYRVLARWVTHPNRCVRAPYDIQHSEGINTVEVNQQLSGGQWNALGVYVFAAGTGSYVEISDRNGRAVIADAVMFQYVSEPPLALGD
ncbi:S8 family serine peptidase [uncultured Thiodictyon sp.]|uniref:golvesin C-terminal-like domain-containing protein n=1 Tax=uncultured Thiodictyon sp. TaxID=1846217 RepID=UPI0025D78BCD|nr:S8 family serine peptidase [uncultured Thiodictyon sp.]